MTETVNKLNPIEKKLLKIISKVLKEFDLVLALNGTSLVKIITKIMVEN